MKRKMIFAIVSLALVIMAMGIGGCGNGNSGDRQTDMQSSTQVSVDQDEAGSSDSSESDASLPSGTNAQESSSEVTPTVEETPEPAFESDRSEAFELLSNITIGWNLGNTFDAHGAGNSLASETYWGCPKTTQEMFDALSAQGFNAVRIPVTYAEHVGKAPDYKINEDWLNRVQEVVDYAIKDDMYVILDTHHETDFWLVTDEKHEAAAIEELSAIWKQVAEHFKDYDDHLIFEGMNEPRRKGSDAEWSGGTKKEREIVNKLNQAFVDTVRSVGGNNENRLLIICTYGNNPSKEAVEDLKIPHDNHIAVAVHMYTPYHFTYDSKDQWEYSTWDGSKKTEIATIAKQLENLLTNNDVPVIVTEFGAVNKNNSEEVIKWIEDFLRIMRVRNMKCFWWDNNCYDTNGENFGIFNRRTLEFFDQNIADALVLNATMEN